MSRSGNRLDVMLEKLASSRSRAMMNRRLHMYQLNYRSSPMMQKYLNRIERITRIRR